VKTKIPVYVILAVVLSGTASGLFKIGVLGLEWGRRSLSEPTDGARFSVPYGDAQLRYRMFSVGAMLWYRLQ